MNTLINMDPWSFLDDVLTSSSRTFQAMKARAAGRFPPVNVYLGDQAVLIELELPGRTAADVELSLEPQAVIVADKPKAAEGESPAPAWSRRIELPYRVNPNAVKAKFASGILRIELAKAEEAKVRTIAIEG